MAAYAVRCWAARNSEDYTRQAAFLGASVGRYANRIGNSRFPLDGQLVNVTPSNDAGHQLHGGPEGFDKRRWRIVRADEQEVLFALTSPDGDQGFPALCRPPRTIV